MRRRLSGLVLSAAVGLAASVVPATSAGAATTFHSCGPRPELENNGIFRLKASHAKCALARQVAYGRLHGNESPKGFTCVEGVGGNFTPFRCSRGASLVNFSLEG
jgi:hypothetical protein